MTKRLPAVEIEWIDAHGGEVNPGGWGKLSSSDFKPTHIRTVGILVNRDEAGVMIALSQDLRTPKHHDCYIYIPAAFIKSISNLR